MAELRSVRYGDGNTLHVDIAFSNGEEHTVSIVEPEDGTVLVGVPLPAAALYLTRHYWPLFDFISHVK